MDPQAERTAQLVEPPSEAAAGAASAIAKPHTSFPNGCPARQEMAQGWRSIRLHLLGVHCVLCATSH